MSHIVDRYVCYPLENYFQQIDNLDELHLKNSKSTQKNHLAPSLGQDDPLPGARRPSAWGKTALCLGQDGPLPGARRPSAWGKTALCLGQDGPLPGATRPSAWDKTALCLGQDGPLPGARRPSAWGKTANSSLPVVFAYMNEPLPKHKKYTYKWYDSNILGYYSC